MSVSWPLPRKKQLLLDSRDEIVILENYNRVATIRGSADTLSLVKAFQPETVVIANSAKYHLSGDIKNYSTDIQVHIMANTEMPGMVKMMTPSYNNDPWNHHLPGMSLANPILRDIFSADPDNAPNYRQEIICDYDEKGKAHTITGAYDVMKRATENGYRVFKRKDPRSFSISIGRRGGSTTLIRHIMDLSPDPVLLLAEDSTKKASRLYSQFNMFLGKGSRRNQFKNQMGQDITIITPVDLRGIELNGEMLIAPMDSTGSFGLKVWEYPAIYNTVDGGLACKMVFVRESHVLNWAAIEAKCDYNLRLSTEDVLGKHVYPNLRGSVRNQREYNVTYGVEL